jgi:CRP-like cAMP-binding protein
MLAALPDASYAALLPELRIRDVPPGAPLWDHGDPPTRVYFPMTGVIQVKLSMKEALIEVAMIGREAAAGGIGGAGAAMTSGTMLTGGRIAMISAATFRQRSNWHRATGEATQAACGWIATQAQQLCACTSTHRVPQRLSRWLLHVADRVTGDRFDATQEDIALSLGLSRTTVTLEAQGLRDQGLIAYHRRQIKIVDRKRLMACACECYAALAPARWPLFGCEEASPAVLPATPKTDEAAIKEIA